MKRITVYIDESGTLPDPKDKVIVLAAVVPKSKEQMDKLLMKMKKKRDAKRKPGELKFYTSGDKTKMAFLKLLQWKKLLFLCL